jgi:hypothetical protein
MPLHEVPHEDVNPHMGGNDARDACVRFAVAGGTVGDHAARAFVRMAGFVAVARGVKLSCFMRALHVVVLVVSAGCTNEYHPEYHPETSYSVHQSVSYPTNIFQMTGGSVVATAPPETSSDPNAPPIGDPSSVQVFESSKLDHPGEVVGLIDVTATGTRDAALVEVRRRAAQMGADAVVGLEFHKGQDGRLARVSGLGVRLEQRDHSASRD